MTGPSVLVIAEFDDALHAHAAQRCRALERLDCRVEAFDLQERPGILGRLTGKDLVARLRKAVTAVKADVVLAIGAAPLDRQTVTELAAVTSIPWANWFPDDLRTIDEALDRAPAYQHVFAAGTDVAGKLADHLRRPIDVIPLAADPSIYRPLHSRDQYRANVVFAGAATARRETLLAGLVEFGLALWGPGWRKTSLRDYCRGEVPTTETYVRAYAGASVAINIHHLAGKNGTRQESYVNQRVFELASIGVPQVVDCRGDLDHHFEVGTHLLVFNTGDELKQLVRAALQDFAASEAIGRAARKAVLSGHTYMHRMKEILERITGKR
jgi:spore maturation protein CgeB